MASEQAVKEYLAYWFQLGKKVVIGDRTQSVIPQQIMQGEGYGQEFENCWQQITAPNVGNSYLEGTLETISELLTENWHN